MSEKSTKTQLEKYGKLGFNLPKSYEHRRATVDRLYGGEPLSNLDIRAKREITMIEKYGYEYNLRVRESWVELKPSVFSENDLKRFEEDFDLLQMLNGYNIHYEIDDMFGLRFPTKDLVIEVCPKEVLPWDYHLAKTNLAKEKGYRCIHIFDWDDRVKILNLLLPKVNIDVSECQMLNLHVDIANQFLDQYDLKGRSGKKMFALGLVYYNKLIQIMVLGKPEYNHHHYVELLRLCSAPQYNVIGGAKQMFEFAVNNLELDNIVAYCDISKFSTEMFEELGMKFQYNTRPDRWWSKDREKIKDSKFLRLGYSKLFNKEKDQDLSDEEMMVKDGWFPIYDCGRACFVYQAGFQPSSK